MTHFVLISRFYCSFLKDKPILLDIEITWYNVFVTERRGAAEGTGELIESWVCRIETSAL